MRQAPLEPITGCVQLIFSLRENEKDMSAQNVNTHLVFTFSCFQFRLFRVQTFALWSPNVWAWFRPRLSVVSCCVQGMSWSGSVWTEEKLLSGLVLPVINNDARLRL